MGLEASTGSRWVAAVAVAWVCASPDPGAAFQTADPLPRALSPAEVARSALPSVVHVVTYADGRKLGGGSGFLVGSEGLVVTSHHVLEGAERVEVVLHSGRTFEVLHATAADDRWDLAILRITGFELPVARLGDSRAVAVGERIVAIGSPLGLAGSVSDGLVSARREMEGREVLQVSAPISKGSSGGPVFDARGRVIGVLAGFMRRGQNVNFAVPVEHVRALLDLPPRVVPIGVVARKSVSLLPEAGETVRPLSLQAVLGGEPVPGEEETPWARAPRLVRSDRVDRDPARGPDELAGLWEIRELTRVPLTRSAIYRGALASDGERLHGVFFGGLTSDPAPDAPFVPDRVRAFDGRLLRVGHLVLDGEHGCTYFLRASPRAMTGVYECVEEGKTYDLGAVEARRIEGEAFSGRYRIAERIELGGSRLERSGEAYLLALSDGRWIGQLRFEGAEGRGVVSLRQGRWTPGGRLSARVRGPSGAPARGRLGGTGWRLEYAAGGADYPARARVKAVRIEPVDAP